MWTLARWLHERGVKPYGFAWTLAVLMWSLLWMATGAGLLWFTILTGRHHG